MSVFLASERKPLPKQMYYDPVFFKPFLGVKMTP